MDDELGELGGPLVTVPAVPNEELGEVAELFDGEVGSQTCLPTFLTDNTHTNIGGLDHRDIVTTISNAADALLGVSSDELGHVGFLSRRTSTGHDGW